jgi:hypothetical protein
VEVIDLPLDVLPPGGPRLVMMSHQDALKEVFSAPPERLHGGEGKARTH